MNVDDFDDNDARSETSFAACLNSVACDNVIAIASNFGVGVKGSRSHTLGAWALMELKTRGVDEKFCNATSVADETQMCTTECTLDILENWTSSGCIDRQLVSETRKGPNNKTADDGSSFGLLGKELEKWVHSQLKDNQLNGGVSVKQTNEHQVESAGMDGTGTSDQKSMATVLQRWVHGDQQPRREESSGCSMEVEQKVERRIASRFPEITMLLREKRSSSRKEKWSRLEASGLHLRQDFKRNGSYSGR